MAGSFFSAPPPLFSNMLSLNLPPDFPAEGWDAEPSRVMLNPYEERFGMCKKPVPGFVPPYSPPNPSPRSRACVAVCLPYPLPATFGIRRPVNKSLLKPAFTSLLCNYFHAT